MKCAFHPQQSIVNFCKSTTCYLPMCPICVKLHTEEHKCEETYGQYESIQHVVQDIQYHIQSVETILHNSWNDFSHKFLQKQQFQQDIMVRIADAKTKCLIQIDKLFNTVEASVSRSLLTHSQNTSEDFSKVEEQINSIRQQLAFTEQNLNNEKSLKTIITFYSDNAPSHWNNKIESIKKEVMNLQMNQVLFKIDYKVLNEAIEKLEGLVKLQVRNPYSAPKMMNTTSTIFGMQSSGYYSS